MPVSDALRYTNAILDPVHGIVRLSNEERAILNHPLFQRLHRIRQNGLLYTVFPAASHTRFEHSLGVLHLAQAVIDSLLRNGYAAQQKGRAKNFQDAEPGEAVALHTVPPDTLSALFRVARLAGLVHDLGHGPLSHTFDSFAPKVGAIKEIVRSAPQLAMVRGLSEVIGCDPRPGKPERDRVEHEEMSCVFFACIWNQLMENGALCKEQDPEARHIPGVVAAAILDQPHLCLSVELRPYVSLLHDLIASAPLDADRMDYLERDSRSIGVTYGLYDRERVLRSLLPCRPLNEANGAPLSGLRLAVKRSGLRAVENFVQARFQLFVQVYYHKTNRATAAMLDEIAETASKEGVDLFTHSDLNDLIEEYVDLSDERFLKILRSNSSIPQELRDTADALSRRSLWKRVVEFTQADVAMSVEAALEAASTEAEEPLTRKQAIKDAVKTRLEAYHEALMEVQSGATLYVDAVDPKATKDLDDGTARILHRDGDGVYRLHTDRSWADELPSLRALAEEEVSIGRLYYTGNDKATLAELRSAALKPVNNG